MLVDTEIQHSAYTCIRAPRGTMLSCKGWQQEAAMRMLMNNFDEEVGERPQDLVVYGGTGKAARNWDFPVKSGQVKRSCRTPRRRDVLSSCRGPRC